MTLRTDIMRKKLISITLAAAPGLTACVWSPFRAAIPELPYAEWRPIAQPGAIGSIIDTETTTELSTQVDVVVAAVVVLNQPYRIDLNFSSVETTPLTGATPETIRNALVAAVNDDREDVTATPTASDTFRIEANSPGALWRVLVTPTVMSAAAAVGSPTEIVTIQQSPLKMTASLNIYSSDVATDSESALFANQIDLAIRSQRVSAELALQNLSATRIAAPVNLDGVPFSDDEFESRTAIDFEIGLPSWGAALVSNVDTCAITLRTEKGDTVIPV